MVTFRDRITELRRVPASELLPNPKNWRRHPPSQKNALNGVLEEIGFADAVIARETDEGLQLIDGHLRQTMMGNDLVPVLVVDLSEDEADKLLATLDPLAMMASADHDMLLPLLETTAFENEAINAMLEALTNDERHPLPPLYDTSFLDEALAADEKGLPFPTFDSEDDTEEDDDGLMNFVIRVTPAQRTIIMAAVNQMKQTHNEAITTTEALVEICRAG